MTGKDKSKSLNADKVKVMQTALRLKVYGPEMTDENFGKYIWSTCKTAIGNLCKCLRKDAGFKLVKGVLVPISK